MPTTREQTPAAEAAGDATEIDPIIVAFTDEIVQKAIELAQALAGKYTTDQILEQAGLAVSLAAGRMNKPKKVSAWDIALREAKKDMTPEELAPVAGAGYKGRPGLKGALMKHASTSYADPDTRRRFQELADEENTNRPQLALDSLEAHQKKMLKKLKDLVSSPTGFRDLACGGICYKQLQASLKSKRSL
jgi:hypothetical protein